MKTCRNLLLATIVALSCLLAFQPAGAVVASALNQADRACDDIGPLPYRLTTLGFGVSDPQVALKSALLAAPACFDAEEPASDTASNNARTCNIVGPTASSAVTVSGFAPACMISPDLLAPADVQNYRVCDTNDAMLKQAHPCASPD